MGTALENARLYEAQVDVATTLQRSLLPARLADVAGLELAARYQTATAHTEAGGDWYEAVEMPGGRVFLAVGDVVGRGTVAASVMGQLRSAMRAYALASFRPARGAGAPEPLRRRHPRGRGLDGRVRGDRPAVRPGHVCLRGAPPPRRGGRGRWRPHPPRRTGARAGRDRPRLHRGAGRAAAGREPAAVHGRPGRAARRAARGGAGAPRRSRGRRARRARGRHGGPCGRPPRRGGVQRRRGPARRAP